MRNINIIYIYIYIKDKVENAVQRLRSPIVTRPLLKDQSGQAKLLKFCSSAIQPAIRYSLCYNVPFEDVKWFFPFSTRRFILKIFYVVQGLFKYIYTYRLKRFIRIRFSSRIDYFNQCFRLNSICILNLFIYFPFGSETHRANEFKACLWRGNLRACVYVRACVIVEQH